MKKLVIVFLASALFGGTVFAAGSGKSLGIGAVYGGGVGSDSPDGSIGLSLHLPSVPIYWGIRLSINNSDMNLGLTGDYYFIDEKLPIKGGIDLDWFLGLGAYGNFGFYEDAVISAGARMPIGVSWRFAKVFELWSALAPSLGLVVAPDFSFPQFYWAYEIGIRAWLK